MEGPHEACNDTQQTKSITPGWRSLPYTGATLEITPTNWTWLRDKDNWDLSSAGLYQPDTKFQDTILDNMASPVILQTDRLSHLDLIVIGLYEVSGV